MGPPGPAQLEEIRIDFEIRVAKTTDFDMIFGPIENRRCSCQGQSRTTYMDELGWPPGNSDHTARATNDALVMAAMAMKLRGGQVMEILAVQKPVAKVALGRERAPVRIPVVDVGVDGSVGLAGACTQQVLLLGGGAA